MANNDEERRAGEDRRVTEVSHRTLYDKQLEHDSAIADIQVDLHDLKNDVGAIKDDIMPISQGISSIVFLFKTTIALGALAAAMLGIFEFLEYTQGGK